MNQTQPTTTLTSRPALFGPNRVLLGNEDQEWAVYLTGTGDLFEKPSIEQAAASAAEFNASAYATYDGHPMTPVTYALVLRNGYAWTQSTEHRAGRDCGLTDCVSCAAVRMAAVQ